MNLPCKDSRHPGLTGHATEIISNAMETAQTTRNPESFRHTHHEP